MTRPACHPALLRLLLAAVLAASGAAHAQDATHSGDAWVDGRMADIGTYATTYRDAFVDELVRYHRAPRELVVELLARPGWTPGDAYLACSLAMQAGRPCRDIVALREREPSRDWAAIADELGLAPGTPGYLALKRGIVAAYDRWARPVAVDAELAPLFPNRPRTAPATTRTSRPAPSRPVKPPAEGH
ncbi:hypothetical protein [Cognatilysobacter segetis]|uniref:hypothetical protein n=1 Tax=Cognatilysobacter segetis TaxID=2492394 RepID=UPI00105F863E|nr:hypothetical protein [Lysobacter segetis]